MNLRRYFALLAVVFCFSSLALASDDAPSSGLKMGKPRYIVGGIVGVYPGFGLGHVIQGRWLETGYIFTAGEVSSLLVASVGLVSCVGDNINDKNNKCGSGVFVLGVAGFLGFKVWEIVDVWSGPVRHSQITERNQPEPIHCNLAVLPPTYDRPAELALGVSF